MNLYLELKWVFPCFDDYSATVKWAGTKQPRRFCRKTGVLFGIPFGELTFAHPCCIPVCAGVPACLVVHPDLPINTITHSGTLNHYHDCIIFFTRCSKHSRFLHSNTTCISGFGCFLTTVTGINEFSLETTFDQRAVKARIHDHTSSHLFGKVYLRARNIFVQGVTLSLGLVSGSK